MTRGVLIYAHNNTEIDYFRIACANALMVQHNLKVPVTLVTDNGTAEWGKSSLGSEFLDKCFENIIIVDRDYTFTNPKNFNDTSFTSKSLQFYNCRHHMAYELTPYDETLFIDADYLIMSSALDNCWGSDNDVMIDYRTLSLNGAGPKINYIDDFGIKLYWATVIYFKKTPLTKHLFSLVEHVEQNYQYYRDVYYFSNGMFRNDNAFSIAVHTLNGFTDSLDTGISRLPISGLLMAWDNNDIHSIPAINDIIMYAEKDDAKGTYTLVRLRNTDIHIMNKWAINRMSSRIIELYKKDNICHADI